MRRLRKILSLYVLQTSTVIEVGSGIYNKYMYDPTIHNLQQFRTICKTCVTILSASTIESTLFHGSENESSNILKARRNVELELQHSCPVNWRRLAWFQRQRGLPLKNSSWLNFQCAWHQTDWLPASFPVVPHICAEVEYLGIAKSYLIFQCQI